jgi:hypothetical protein
MTIRKLCSAYRQQQVELDALREQIAAMTRRADGLRSTWVDVMIYPLGAAIAKYFKHRTKYGRYFPRLPLYPVHVNYGGPFGLCARVTIDVKRKSNILFTATFEVQDLSTAQPRLLVTDWHRPIPVEDQCPPNSLGARNHFGQPTIDVTNWTLPRLIRWAQTQARAKRRRT